MALGLGVFWSFVHLFQWSMALCSLYQPRVQQVTFVRTLVFAQHFLVLSHEGTNFDYKVVSSRREGCGCKGWGWKAGGYFLCLSFPCIFTTCMLYVLFLHVHCIHDLSQTYTSYIYLIHLSQTSISYVYIYIYTYQYIYIDVYILYI